MGLPKGAITRIYNAHIKPTAQEMRLIQDLVDRMYRATSSQDLDALVTKTVAGGKTVCDYMLIVLDARAGASAKVISSGHELDTKNGKNLRKESLARLACSEIQLAIEKKKEKPVYLNEEVIRSSP